MKTTVNILIVGAILILGVFVVVGEQLHKKEVEDLEENISLLISKMAEKEMALNKQLEATKNLKEKLIEHNKTISDYKKSDKEKTEQILKLKKQLEEKKKSEYPPSQLSRGKTNSSMVLQMEATYYTAFCPTGCIGVTATGMNVKNTIYHNNMRVVAVDPKVIPLYSIVRVSSKNGSFIAIAGDTGGDIKGNRIDILVKTREEAYKLGRHGVTVEVIREGKGK